MSKRCLDWLIYVAFKFFFFFLEVFGKDRDLKHLSLDKKKYKDKLKAKSRVRSTYGF